jgi:CO/xanthine dehydrogenase FAD-binding subunit
MIVEYHCPNSIEEALSLLGRTEPITRPLGGGAIVSRSGPNPYAVVDLQKLGLDKIERQGNQLVIGAAATLQSLYDNADIQPALREAIRRETTYNLRQSGTVAGALVASGGNSTFATAMMALDAQLVWLPGEKEVSLGNYLPLRGNWQESVLIIRIVIPLNTGLKLECVSRTPSDKSILVEAMAKWPSGRTRVVVGGPWEEPKLAHDGQDDGGIVETVKNACSHEGNQTKYNIDYLKETAAVLAHRILNDTLAANN